MPPTPVKGSPVWDVKRLHDRLTKRKKDLCQADDYYEGKHKLAFATEKFRQAFGNLFSVFADNWCSLVVDSVTERLHVQGFRFGDNPEADGDAWDIWQANNLDAGSDELHTDGLVAGLAYTLVQPGVGDGYPQITPESAQQCVVAYEPGTYRRTAGLKEWWDEGDTDLLFATLYRPDGIWKFQSSQKVQSDHDLGLAEAIQWKPRELANGEQFPLLNTLGVVPLIPFENRARLLHPGKSEIAEVIPVQDAVNKLCADMMVGSEFQAYRQRVLMGVEVPVDPNTNQPIDAFKHAVNRLWMIENENAKMFEFSPIDLGNFVKAIEMYVSHIASQTRTPPHYFERPGGQFPSGESIKAAETGLVAKCRRKMTAFGESWEETLRLAFATKGDARAQEFAAETIWGDPESRSEAQHVDAVLKKMALGVPQRQLWEDLGYTEEQIGRFVEMRKEETALYPPPALVPPPAPMPAMANGNGATP